MVRSSSNGVAAGGTFIGTTGDTTAGLIERRTISRDNRSCVLSALFQKIFGVDLGFAVGLEGSSSCGGGTASE